MTTQEKWEKTQLCIHWIAKNMTNEAGLLNLKTLKSYRGFFVDRMGCPCQLLPAEQSHKHIACAYTTNILNGRVECGG
jgi:hypothetical protein